MLNENSLHAAISFYSNYVLMLKEKVNNLSQKVEELEEELKDFNNDTRKEEN